MPKIYPFETYPERYDFWYEKNLHVYEAELRAIKTMMPVSVNGLEIGVGTGRFAEALGIATGVDPSKHMREMAHKRGIRALDGVAEKLPFNDSQFDLVLMVTTVCFVDDLGKSLSEANRVLSNNGIIIIGFVDRNSLLGKEYIKQQKENIFYKEATFFSVGEMVEHMDHAGFRDLTFKQTIFGTLAETAEDEPVKSGYGEGSFAVIRGRKEQKENTREIDYAM